MYVQDLHQGLSMLSKGCDRDIRSQTIPYTRNTDTFNFESPHGPDL